MGYGYVNLEKFARHYAGKDPLPEPEERPRSASTGRLSEYSERFGGSRVMHLRDRPPMSPVTPPFRRKEYVLRSGVGVVRVLGQFTHMYVCCCLTCV